jgi:hypothetical protein
MRGGVKREANWTAKKRARKMSHVVNAEGVACGRDGELWGVDIAEGAEEIVAEVMEGLVERMTGS